MRKVSAVIIMLWLSLDGSIIDAQDVWVGKDGNIRNVDAKAILIDEQGLYLATASEIYAASDRQDKWQPIFSLPAGGNEISCIAGNSRNILVGTRRGVFRSQDRGKSWRNVFKTILPEKSNILCIEVSRHSSGKVLIGTEKGIFESLDAGSRWRDASGILKNRRVGALAINKTCAYALSDSGLYIKRDESSGWERLYIRGMVSGSENETAEEPADETEEDPGASLSCMALKGARLYIGAGKRISYSDDGGKRWTGFPRGGLTGAVTCIAAPEKQDKLYCATTKGVFEFEQGRQRWLELYKGMDKVLSINKIVFDGDDEKSIWALTGRGLYRLESGKYASDQYIDVERNLKSLKIIFDNEPPFRRLQQAAMKFNEVSPEKIRRWRDEARLKALLPKVSLGADKNRSTNYEIYTSATRDYVTAGPDDTSNGFDVSVSWELGDLIWSDDQANIDVRSRLTTQLRNDILDDLRRVYYERKRLQFELASFPPKDLKARFDKEIRIQELTQAIDDLTGNYFSEHIKNGSF